MDINTYIAKVREDLKELVTAENTDKVAQVSKSLDTLSEQAQKLGEENVSLKDKIVDMVKGTLSTDNPPVDEVKDEAPKSLDVVIGEIAEKYKDKK